VLVSKELVCKVGDFGLSVDLSDEEDGIYCGSATSRIPIRWCAIEAVIFRKFSLASDVWSYGILLWEIFTYAEMPYQAWTNQKVVEELQKGFRLAKPDNCPDAVYECMLKCWDREETGRPSFLQIHEILVSAWERSTGIVADRRKTSIQGGIVQASGMSEYTLAGSFSPLKEEDSSDDEDDPSAKGKGPNGMNLYDNHDFLENKAVSAAKDGNPYEEQRGLEDVDDSNELGWDPKNSVTMNSTRKKGSYLDVDELAD